jgi:uncharacterized protein YbbK (DUF523 family)
MLGQVVPFCPEIAGGLTLPRPPAEIEGAHAGLDGHAVLDGRTRVVCRDGSDVTAQFLKGAQGAVAVARQMGIQRAILKSNSPSCGVGCTHDGRFSGVLVPGDGVAAALLQAAGITVFTERDLAEAIL